MDWESLYGPNRGCRYDGRPFLQGQLIKHGSSHGQKQARCGACETPVSIRYGTASLDLHADPPIFETAVRACAAGKEVPDLPLLDETGSPEPVSPELVG